MRFERAGGSRPAPTRARQTSVVYPHRDEDQHANACKVVSSGHVHVRNTGKGVDAFMDRAQQLKDEAQRQIAAHRVELTELSLRIHSNRSYPWRRRIRPAGWRSTWQTKDSQSRSPPTDYLRPSRPSMGRAAHPSESSPSTTPCQGSVTLAAITS